MLMVKHEFRSDIVLVLTIPCWETGGRYVREGCSGGKGMRALHPRQDYSQRPQGADIRGECAALETKI